MIAYSVIGRMMDSVDGSPWGASTGRHVQAPVSAARTSWQPGRKRPLYSPEEKRRRDASPWTLVQGVLAPVQFAVFAVSLALVLH